MKLQQKVYHDKHGKGEVVRKQKPYFWVKYDKYEKLLRHEQKQVGRSVKLESKPRLKRISKESRKSNIDVDPNDKYEKLLRHEQKQVGSSVESKLKSRLKPISKREQKWKIINVDPNWKSNNDITYLGKL